MSSYFLFQFYGSPSMTEFVEEGTARIVRTENTFFNPAQKLNRDISAAVIREFYCGKESIRILTAMSATGLRGIRYLNEIPNSTIFFNDISPSAVNSIIDNLKLNGFDYQSPIDSYLLRDPHLLRDSKSRINLTLSDCSVIMNQYHNFFNVIDIDPFGSCAPFIDDALRSVSHNGLICLTCTDKAALCSREDRCYTRYNTRIKHLFAKNETPVRTLLSFVSRQASKFDSSIRPLVCLSVDFYVRVILQVKKNKEKSVLKNNSYAMICECLNIKMQGMKDTVNSTCGNCGQNMKIYGPFWNGGLYDKELIGRVLAGAEKEGAERMVGLLRYMLQELEIPFYYEIPKLASKFKVNSCKIKDIMNALANAGYSASLVYYDTNAFKTDAPIDVICKIMNAKSGNKQANIESGKEQTQSCDKSSEFNFEENQQIKQIFDTEFYKGKIKSGMKPGSLPKYD